MKKITILFFLLSFYAFSQDSTPPVLHSITVLSPIVYAGDSATIQIDITDDITGVSGFGFPNGVYQNATMAVLSDSLNIFYVGTNVWKNVSGNIYNTKFKIPQNARSTTWKLVYFTAYDIAGNNQFYNQGNINCPTFKVISTISDSIPPTLVSLSVTSPIVNSGDYVHVQIEVFDDNSGISGYGFGNSDASYGLSNALISNPTNIQAVVISNWTHISGNIYEGSAKINPYGSNGTWKVDQFYAVDKVGNYKAYTNGTDFNGNFIVNSATPDTLAPMVYSVTVTSPIVALDDSVTIRIEIADDVSGILGYGFTTSIGGVYTEAILRKNNGSQEVRVSKWKHISGNVYEGKTRMINNGGSLGEWYIGYIEASDIAGNYNRYYYTFGDIPNSSFLVVQTRYLDVSPQSLSMTDNPGMKNFTITSNVNWSIVENESWLSASIVSGNGNSVVAIHVDTNAVNSNRIGVVSITGGGISRVLFVNQMSHAESITTVTGVITLTGTNTLTGVGTVAGVVTISGNTSTTGITTIMGITTVTTVTIVSTVITIDGASLTPTLFWSQVPSAAGYCIQISEDPTFQSNDVVSVCGLLTNNYTIPNGIFTNARQEEGYALLADGKKYYWRVSAIVNGQQTAWSTPGEINVATTLAISKENALDELVVFPNPSEGKLSIQYSKAVQLVKLYTMLGVEITRISSPSNPIEFSTNAGLYFLEIYSGGEIVRRKIEIK